MRFDYIIIHVPGKLLHTTDTLSRAPLKLSADSDELMEIQEVEFYISTVISTLPVSDARLNVIAQTQANDHVCSTLISYCHDGWPDNPHYLMSLSHTGNIKQIFQYMKIFCCTRIELSFPSSCNRKFFKNFIVVIKVFNVVVHEHNHSVVVKYPSCY